MVTFCSISLACMLAAAPGEIRGNAFINVTKQLGAGVNTSEFESSPRISPDGLTLHFASLRAGGHGGWDIYRATRNSPEGPFTQVSNLGPPVNTGVSEAFGEISADGRKLIFVKGGDDRWNNAIWVATRSGPDGPFDDAYELPGIRAPGSSDNLPYLTLDEKALFFSSIRAGGVGNFDLWVSTRQHADEEFGPPVLLDEYFPGSQVNTSYDEMSSCLTEDGLALFLSDSFTAPFRPGGMGEADIWVSTRSDIDGAFGEPVNLNNLSAPRGVAVNASTYELFPSVSRSWPKRGAEIYFVSNRPPGDLDIWRATWEAVPEVLFTVAGPDPTGKVSVDGSASSTPEGSGPMTYAWDFGDGTSGEWSTFGAWEKVEHAYTSPGRHPITLTVRNSLGVETTVTNPVTLKCTAPGDVAPWAALDVGTPIFPGSAWKDGEDLHVCAGGTRLGGSDDEFHFVHGEATGDFDAVVQIEEILSWRTWASIGLMARESAASNSRYVAILVYRSTTTSNLRFRFRKDTSASARTGSVTELPRWLMLSRRGSEFVAYSSADGSAWVEADRETVELPQTVLVGVAACGADPGDETQAFLPLQARLSGLAISGRFRRGDSNSDGSINISDPVFNLNYQFERGAAPSCLKTADVNDDGMINLADPISELNYLFASGPVPPIPLAECGVDPTPDALTCESYPPCK